MWQTAEPKACWHMQHHQLSIDIASIIQKAYWHAMHSLPQVALLKIKQCNAWCDGGHNTLCLDGKIEQALADCDDVQGKVVVCVDLQGL